MDKVVIFQVGDKFVRVANKSMKLSLVSDINRASCFNVAKSKTWVGYMGKKYPNVEKKIAQYKLEILT